MPSCKLVVYTVAEREWAYTLVVVIRSMPSCKLVVYTVAEREWAYTLVVVIRSMSIHRHILHVFAEILVICIASLNYTIPFATHILCTHADRLLNYTN